MTTNLRVPALAIAALLALPIEAQDRRPAQRGGDRPDRPARAERPERGGGPEAQHLCALLVASAAESNGDGKVTQEEWAAVFSSAGTGDSVPLPALRRVLLTSRLDRDADGKLSATDLEDALKSLDENKDGALSREEVGGLARRRERGGGAAADGARAGDRAARRDTDGAAREGAASPGDRKERFETRDAATRLVARAADRDHDGAVSKEEWNGFLTSKSRESAGALSDESIATLFEMTPPQREPAGEGRMKRRPQMLAQILDADGDGMVDRASFKRMFQSMDANGDGTADGREMMRPRREQGGDAREHGAAARDHAGGAGEHGRGGDRRRQGDGRRDGDGPRHKDG